MLHIHKIFLKGKKEKYLAVTRRWQQWQQQLAMADDNVKGREEKVTKERLGKRVTKFQRKKKKLGCNLACVMLFFSSALLMSARPLPHGPKKKKKKDAAPYTCRPSNLLDLVPYHHRIVLSDLLSTHFLIVKRTVVLVGISVEAAEETPAATLEAREADLFAAYPTPIFLFLLVLLVVLLAACF